MILLAVSACILWLTVILLGLALVRLGRDFIALRERVGELETDMWPADHAIRERVIRERGTTDFSDKNDASGGDPDLCKRCGRNFVVLRGSLRLNSVSALRAAQRGYERTKQAILTYEVGLPLDCAALCLCKGWEKIEDKMREDGTLEPWVDPD